MKILPFLLLTILVQNLSSQKSIKRYFDKGEFTKISGYKFSAKNIFFGSETVEFITKNGKETFPLNEFSSFQYKKGSHVLVGALVGIGTGGILALLALKQVEFGGQDVLIQVPLFFGGIGAVLGLLSKKKYKILKPAQHFSSTKEILIDLRIEPSGLGFVFRF